MDNPGVKTLCLLQILPNQPLSLLTPIVDLDGMTAVNLDFDFRYGSGGTSGYAIVVTSFDAGVTWRHIARFDFDTVTKSYNCNIEGLLSLGMTAWADLTSQNVQDGRLGDRLAVLLSSTGNYSNSVLAVRASVR